MRGNIVQLNCTNQVFNKNGVNSINESETFISEIGILLMERKDRSHRQNVASMDREYVKPVFKNNILAVTEDVANLVLQSSAS